jgi:hypothetical protein
MAGVLVVIIGFLQHGLVLCGNIHPPAPAGALPNGQNIQECWPRLRWGGREPVQSGGAAADLVPTLQRKLEYPSFLAGAAQKRPQTCAGELRA